jgi:hypothetical protein
MTSAGGREPVRKPDPAGRRPSLRRVNAALVAAALAIAACSPSPAPVTPSPIVGVASTGPVAQPSRAVEPAWFTIAMTDVQTGLPFSIHDFAGKVVLVETMAEWCPTCIEQQTEVQAFRDHLTAKDDVVSVSLDIDVHEDSASLKEYAAALDHDWRYAVAPLEVARALGNLYSAEYLNPPYSPMLLVARDGAVVSLPYGVKKADYLQTTVEPYLGP